MFKIENWNQYWQVMEGGPLTTNGCEGYNSAFAGNYTT